MFKISISPEEIESLNYASFPGKIKVIEKVGWDFFLAVRYLSRQKVIGFDTESRPCFSPSQPHYGVSLLQLSGPDKAFLFRIKLMGGIPKSLCKILANEKILKIGAAVNDDVRGLEKHHSFEPKSFVDLQKMVWEYGIKDKSVKKMAAIILGMKISKTQQLSNWEAQTLSDSQQAYAATDAWVCLKMYEKLLESEKHPLTPEQMLPNPPKNPVDVANIPASEGQEDEKKAPSKRSSHRRRPYNRRKPAGAKTTEEATTANAATSDKPAEVKAPSKKPRTRKPAAKTAPVAKPEGVEGGTNPKGESASPASTEPKKKSHNKRWPKKKKVNTDDKNIPQEG